MTTPSIAHARLRKATASDHARVDACFAQGLHDDASYQRYLCGMQVLLQSLANADAGLAEEYAAHRAHIEQDLQTLGMEASFPVPGAPRIHSDTARLGARYVIEGSAMGARVLQRQAATLGHAPARGAAFLAYHAGRGATHWPRCMDALAGQNPASPGFETLLATARDTFALAARCFDPMGTITRGANGQPSRD